MRTARKVLSHLNVIFAGMFLTFLIVDRFNPTMSFIDNDISKWLLCCFSLTALALAVITLRAIHRRELVQAQSAAEREAMQEEILERPPTRK